MEAVFRPELFSDEFLRVPCAFLWETVGNHQKKFRESFGRNTASIFQCVSSVFQWNVPEMRRVSPVPAVRLCPGNLYIAIVIRGFGCEIVMVDDYQRVSIRDIQSSKITYQSKKKNFFFVLSLFSRTYRS